MGFNYLQTDDRDDYFAQLSKHNNYKTYQLVSSEDKIIFHKISISGLKKYLKKNYQIDVKLHTVKSELAKKGYKIYGND